MSYNISGEYVGTCVYAARGYLLESVCLTTYHVHVCTYAYACRAWLLLHTMLHTLSISMHIHTVMMMVSALILHAVQQHAYLYIALCRLSISLQTFATDHAKSIMDATLYSVIHPLVYLVY